MHVPTDSEPSVSNDARIRLRRDVYDALTLQRGAVTVADQVHLTGLPRKTLYRIRKGGRPSLDSAMKIAAALGTSFDAVFERVGEQP